MSAKVSDPKVCIREPSLPLSSLLVCVARGLRIGGYVVIVTQCLGALAA